MKTAAAAFRNDVRLQVRHGFYAAYFVVDVVLIVVLRVIPASPRGLLLPMIAVFDQAVFGLALGMAVLLTEADEGTLRAVLTTPLGVRRYLVSKVASIALLCAGGATLIGIAGVGRGFAAWPYVPATALIAAVFSLIGIATIGLVHPVRRALLAVTVIMSILFLPLLTYFGVLDAPWMAAFPTDAALRLARGALQPVGGLETAVGLALLIGFTVIGGMLAVPALERLAWRNETGE